MRQLTQRLNPTPEQQKAIRPIVGRAAEDLQRMQREHLADTARTTERMYADVSALLTPEQRAKLEQMRQEMLERVRREREKRGEVPPAPNVAAKPGGRPAAPGKVEKDPKTSP
jgi:Spy/CpxP family protein refolding chaperone